VGFSKELKKCQLCGQDATTKHILALCPGNHLERQSLTSTIINVLNEHNIFNPPEIFWEFFNIPNNNSLFAIGYRGLLPQSSYQILKNQIYANLYEITDKKEKTSKFKATQNLIMNALNRIIAQFIYNCNASCLPV
jgi:hypothetical protein